MEIRMKWLFGIFVLLLFLVAFYLVINKPLPPATSGAEAERLAHQMMKAINHQAWDSTAAVMWTFGGKHNHLWDRERHYARVSWGRGYTAWLEINTLRGRVEKDGELITNEKNKARLLQKAYKLWANDSFWLNPISKLYDEGVVRALVHYKSGKKALLVTYTSGGVTPGDSYLWKVDKNGLPYKWELWVKIVPIGGLSFSWEDWITTETGVKICTLHKSPVKTVRLTNVKTAFDLSDLIQMDEFAFLDKND